MHSTLPSGYKAKSHETTRSNRVTRLPQNRVTIRRIAILINLNVHVDNFHLAVARLSERSRRRYSSFAKCSRLAFTNVWMMNDHPFFLFCYTYVYNYYSCSLVKCERKKSGHEHYLAITQDWKQRKFTGLNEDNDGAFLVWCVTCGCPINTYGGHQ